MFGNLQELKNAIHRFLDDTNANPKPFTWTKKPNKIIAAVKRGHQVVRFDPQAFTARGQGLLSVALFGFDACLLVCFVCLG